MYVNEFKRKFYSLPSAGIINVRNVVKHVNIFHYLFVFLDG